MICDLYCISMLKCTAGGGLFPSDNAKLGIKKPMGVWFSIGVEFLGIWCREVPFYGSFARKCPNFVGVFGSFGGVFISSVSRLWGLLCANSHRTAVRSPVHRPVPTRLATCGRSVPPCVSIRLERADVRGRGAKLSHFRRTRYSCHPPAPL